MEEKDNIVKTVTTQQTEYDQPLLQNTYQPKEYTNQMAQKALEDAEQSAGFLSIVDQWKNKNKELQQRKQQAVQNTKMLAWGNLFTNLAKIAGMGNAPVVQNDTGVLNKAFSEVDKLRDLHYATKDAYDNAKASYKMQYAQNDRQQFQANEAARYKAAQKFVDDTNEKILKGGKKTTTVEKSDPYAEAKRKREERELSVKEKTEAARQKSYESQAALNNAKATNEGTNKSNKEPFYVFDNPKDGYSYTIDISKGTDILNSLARIKAKDGISEELKRAIEDDTALLSKLFSYGYTIYELRSIVSRYLNEYPEEFSDVLSKVPREKTKQSSSNSSDDGVSFTADNSSNSSALNFISF